MDSDIASRKIFIGGLSYGTDDEKLRQYFQQFGAVHDAVVMKDPISRRSRGFGFITYEQASFVDLALAREIHTIDSRQVEAKRAVPRSETRDVPPKSATISSALPNQSNFIPSSPSSQQPLGHSALSSSSSPSSTPRHDNISNSTKIFVGGLHYDTRDVEFRNYFEKFGRVVTSEVMFNRETHKSRGFGFIVFESERSVDDVCAEREHFIDGKLVEVKRAVPRSKIASLSPSSSQPPPSPSSTSSSYSSKPSTSLLHGANQIPSFGSRSNSFENFSLTPSHATATAAADKGKGKSGDSAISSPSSYAAALKSGSHQFPVAPLPGDPSGQSSNGFPSSPLLPPPHQQQQGQGQQQYGGLLLSEPVNVTDLHLRNHANSLSELDLLHNSYSANFPFGQYDHQSQFQQQQQLHFPPHFLHTQQQLANQYSSHENRYGHSHYSHIHSGNGSGTGNGRGNDGSCVTPNNSPMSPLTIPSRHRAHTESFLIMQSSSQQSHHLFQNYHPPRQSQPFSQRSSASSPATATAASASASVSSPFGSLNPNVPTFTPEYLQHQQLQQEEQVQGLGQEDFSSFHSHHPPSLSSHSPLSHSPATTPNWESFERHRGGIERSVSLDWAPTSLTSPSRRGMSDVGLHDLRITLDNPPGHPQQLQSLSPGSSHSHSQTAALSEEAWASLIDLTMGPNDSSFSESNSNNGNSHGSNLTVQFDYRDYSELSLSQSQEGEGEGIQELRLQAREFIPQSHHPRPQQQQQQWSSALTSSPSSASTPPSSPATSFK